MFFSGKIFGGLLGLFLFGPVGLIIGIFLGGPIGMISGIVFGHMIDKGKELEQEERSGRRSSEGGRQ